MVRSTALVKHNKLRLRPGPLDLPARLRFAPPGAGGFRTAARRIPVSTLSACRRTRLPPLPAEDGVSYGLTAAGRLRPPAPARRLAELPKATFERGR